jgi:hypothetical protein
VTDMGPPIGVAYRGCDVERLGHASRGLAGLSASINPSAAELGGVAVPRARQCGEQSGQFEYRAMGIER